MSLFSLESPVLGSATSLQMDGSDPNTGTSSKKMIPYEVVTINLVAASVTSGTIWTAPKSQTLRGKYAVAYVTVTAGVAGGASAALDIVQAADGTAISGGTSLLASTVNLQTITAATLTEASMAAGVTAITIGVGNRLGYKLSGTLTGLADCNVSIYLERIA